MISSKASILPPLLISILLFTTSNLKVGEVTKNLFQSLFSPISTPLTGLKGTYQTNLTNLQNLPNTNRQNREQKVLIAHLIRENESLKQALKDSKIESNFKGSYQKVIPLKVSGSKGKLLGTSSQSLDEIKSGMPVVSGNILLGLVTEVNDKLVSIISTEDDLFPPLALKSSSGPQGTYRHHNGISQIVNVPSQTPIILGDFVLTNPTDLIPENLLVGKISKITTTPQEPLQKGEVNLYDTFTNNPENIVVIVKP